MSRRLIFPDPVTYSHPRTLDSKPWGLADLITEKALSNPDLLSSVENCNRVIGLIDKFKGMKSEAQKGKSLVLLDSDYEFLGMALVMTLQRFARESGGALPLEFTADIAGYMRAFHSAEVVRENDNHSEVHATGASLPGGVA